VGQLPKLLDNRLIALCEFEKNYFSISQIYSLVISLRDWGTNKRY